MNRGAWWATVHSVAKSWTQLKQLSTQAHAHTYIHTHTHIYKEGEGKERMNQKAVRF